MQQKKRGMATIIAAAVLVAFFLFGLNILRMWGQRRWVPNTPFRLLLIGPEGKQLKILTIWPNLQDPAMMKIPDDMFIPAVGGYGNFQPSALLTMGQVDGIGDRLLVDSLGFMLGGTIHRAENYDGEKLPGLSLKWKLWGEGLAGRRSLLEAIEMSRLLDVNQSTIREVELSEANVIRDRAEVDGSIQKYAEPALLEALVSREMMTMWPEAADVQVAIINGSNMTQMATVWSRFARVAGFDVVSVTDIPTQNKNTGLIFSSKELMKSRVGKALMTLYPQAKAQVGETGNYRADVALIIGLDSWQWLNQRGAYLARKFWD